MQTIKERLTFDHLLSATPIPNEPMTLKELHKANGGFPFMARRIVMPPDSNDYPIGTIVTVIDYFRTTTHYRLSKADRVYIYYEGIQTECGLDAYVIAWTFA